MTEAFVAKKAISVEEMAEMFLELEFKSYEEVAMQYRLDIEYPTSKKRQAKMGRIYKQVTQNPEKFGLSQDICERVARAKNSRVSERAVELHESSTRGVVTTEKVEDIKSDIIITRDMALRLVQKKLRSIDENDIEDINLVQLTTAFGTIFDKSRILMGEATENIAVLAKIDPNMKPEDALKAILEMREVNQEAKESKKS